MDKKIYELTPNDLIDHPVWIFPAYDDEVDDETISPVLDIQQLGDWQTIVRANFTDKNGAKYLGYIYWGEPQGVDYLLPVMFLDKQGHSAIDFWMGIREPKKSDFIQAKNILNKNSFPIYFESEEVFGLYSMKGKLGGIYYLKDDIILEKKIPF